jgi:hypothetical protein
MSLDRGKAFYCFHVRSNPIDLLTRASARSSCASQPKNKYIGYDEIPAQMLPRLMSVRAFDDRHYIVAADVAQGSQLGELAERLLGNRDVSYLHVHHARWGCYVGRIDRA